jgi:hypothetical protein
MSSHIKVYFDEKDVLHICPKDSIGVMALKYWKGEYLEHGDKMLEVDTHVPIKLGYDDPKK